MNREEEGRVRTVAKIYREKQDMHAILKKVIKPHDKE